MEIKRHLEKKLLQWSQSEHRKPLLIRGARQVGKSFLIESFGHKKFEHVVTINFELNPEYIKCFQTLKPTEICEAIKVIGQHTIIPGKTLLFLDEIQDCPNAIQSLRYFKELLPELHVIGAGSLLELVLRQADFRLPVGRVSFLYLYPVSFKEYIAIVNPEALSHIENCSLKHPISPAIHDYLLQQIKHYFFIGGMPESVSNYLELNDFREVQAIQESIISTYRNDFGHYSEWTNPKYLQSCFDQIPQLIGQQIKYNKINPDARSRELKDVLQVLEDTSLLSRINATSATGIPLSAVINPKKFKLNFIDIGLVKRMQKLDASILLEESVMLLNRGALAEQFVGQELLAYSDYYEKPQLYFWTREGSAQVEVDYVIQQGTQIIPLEVKAGKTGKLRSLKQFMIEHHPTCALRVSEEPLSINNNNILSVPFYLMSELTRLLSEFH